MATVQKNKRKICFIITSFIHYSRCLLVLEEMKNRDDIDLHIVIAGAVLLPKYTSLQANIESMLKKDGFDKIYDVHFNLEGGKTITQAKTAGLAMIEFASIFHQLKPDMVVVRGDRFEVLAAAMAASYMNIPVAHIEGGDVSGTIDESVRHAITKLAHIHFPTNEDAKKRILRMGENPDYVFNFGSPDVEVANKLVNEPNDDFDLEKTGSGFNMRPESDYLMVMYHPVTTEFETMGAKTEILLDAVHSLDMPTIWFWPNIDTGSEEISHKLRIFKDSTPEHKIKFMRYVPPKKFIWLLKNARCFVGNSSAGVKECSYLGIPVVNIGSRQDNRLRASNIMDVEHEKDRIKEVIKKQLAVGRYPASDIYLSEGTGKNIAEKLATIDLYIQKSFRD